MNGTVAVITGATGGIGAATARLLDAQGMSLVLTGRAEKALAELAQSLQSATYIAGDITDPTLPTRLIDQAYSEYGRFDVAFNNAGVMNIGAIADIDVEHVAAMVRINVEAAFRFGYVALKRFVAQGSGFLVNTSSIAGLKTAPQIAAYSGTKHAIEAFTDSLRLELAGTGVRVASVQPGTVATALYDHWTPEQRGILPPEGMLRPEDVAQAVLFVLGQPANVLIPRLLVVSPGMPGL